MVEETKPFGKNKFRGTVSVDCIIQCYRLYSTWLLQFNSYIKCGKTGEIIGSLFAKINNLPLDYTDYFALENNARELLAIDDMEIAEVYDKDNVKLTIAQKEHNKSSSIYYHNNDIINKYGVLIGKSRIGISLDRTKTQIHTVAFVLFVIMTLSLVLTALAITYLIGRVINKPLFNLLTPIKMITKGDLSHRIDIKADDEIGEISVNFNIMTEQLNISLKLINNIISSMPSILFSVDRDFRITQWNNAAEVFTRRVKSDVINIILWDACNHFNELRREIENVFTTKKPSELYRIRLSSKPEMVSNISIFPIYDKEFQEQL
jgi:methyl-accepting chemotaxis protein